MRKKKYIYIYTPQWLNLTKESQKKHKKKLLAFEPTLLNKYQSLAETKKKKANKHQLQTVSRVLRLNKSRDIS